MFLIVSEKVPSDREGPHAWNAPSPRRHTQGLGGLFPSFSLPWKGTNISTLFTPGAGAGWTPSRIVQVFLFPSSGRKQMTPQV